MLNPSSQRSVTLRISLALFFFLNFLYLLTSTGRVHTIDEISAVLECESLTLHGTTAVPQAVSSKVYFGRYASDGQPHSPYPPGQPLVAVPWYALGDFIIGRLPGVAAEIRDLVVSMACVWSSATFAALCGMFVFLIAHALGLSRRDSVVTALVVAFASPLFVYSAWFFSEPLTAACWLGAAYALFGTPSDEPVSVRRATIAGVLMGFSLHVRPTNVFAAWIFIAAIFVRDRRHAVKAAITMTLVVGLIGVIYLLRNLSLYGNLFDLGYPRYAENGRDVLSFNMPWHLGLFGFLFSPGKSIFLFCPPIVLAIPGLIRLWRRNRGLAFACGGTALVYLLFYAHYSSWEGAYSYGPRYLVPALLLLCVAIAAWFLDPPRWFRPVLRAVFGVGLVIQMIGLSTNIIEDMVANHYYNAGWYYRMSYSAITGQLRLIAKYIGGAPAPLGMGFDRWFLFATKAGVPAWIVAALFLLMTAGFLISQFRLLRLLQKSN